MDANSRNKADVKQEVCMGTLYLVTQIITCMYKTIIYEKEIEIHNSVCNWYTQVYTHAHITYHLQYVLCTYFCIHLVCRVR